MKLRSGSKGASDKTITLVIGPTASGKSIYAQRLALKVHGEIVNCDSQQFFRGLNIGTGKVPAKDRKVPYWLLDTLDPGQSMSAGEFARQADRVIEDIFSRGRTAILVGGTGLYVRALLEGFDSLPPRNPKIRDRLMSEIKEVGAGALHRRLEEVDPVQASRVSPSDIARLVRFLELYEVTGKAPSRLLKKGRATTLRYPTRAHWLCPPREALREKISRRVHQMLAAGWEQEVAGLLDRGLDPRRWENKPIGYSDLARSLSEGLEKQDVIGTIIQKTKAYAKRQETFFRGMFSNPAYHKGNSRLKKLENFGENF